MLGITATAVTHMYALW